MHGKKWTQRSISFQQIFFERDSELFQSSPLEISEKPSKSLIKPIRADYADEKTSKNRENLYSLREDGGFAGRQGHRPGEAHE
jgi:hypothetical protein